MIVISFNFNYARWLPIHLRDMMTLEQCHPEVAKEFQNGNFVVHKSCRTFSAMAIDQAHEQANAVIKGDGGAIGLTEDASALRRWMVAGPEVSHLVAEYEAASGAMDATVNTKHHEQTMRAQQVFLEKADKLTRVLQDFGNPFQEESSDLLSLDTKDIAQSSALELLSKHYDRGIEKCHEFMKGLESQGQELFYKSITRNTVNFFKQESATTDSKEKILKADRNLFSQLFISCQNRQCDLRQFFKYENQPIPASLSDSGGLHSCQKSDLTDILQSKVTTPDTEPEVEAIIIDGSALVNSLPPRTSTTFDEYARETIIPNVTALSEKYKRTDVVFDVYLPSSLKSETRMKRGTGARRRVTGTNKTPKNWKNFMRHSQNKTELFCFLADKIADTDTVHPIVVTKEELALSNCAINLDEISPCTHEEADTCLFVHARHAVQEGNK